MHRAAIRCEIRSLPVSISKQPKQIVRELARHVVHINPDGKIQRVRLISVQPISLAPILQIVEPLYILFSDGTDSIISNWRGRFWDFLSQEILERSHEGSFGFDLQVGVRNGSAGER